MGHDHDSKGRVIPELLVGQGWCEKHRRVHPTGHCPDCSLERSKAQIDRLLDEVKPHVHLPGHTRRREHGW